MAGEPDEPENHTLRMLREMREENRHMHAQTRAELASVLEVAVEMAKVVNAMHAEMDGLGRGQKIIENELRGLRGRVERIEDKLDLVKA